MSEKQIYVVLSTCLATNRGSFGVGDSYPCKSVEEAQRMIDAKQAKTIVNDSPTDSDGNDIALANEALTSELESLKVQTQKRINELTAENSTLEKSLQDASKELINANKKLKAAENKLKKQAN